MVICLDAEFRSNLCEAISANPGVTVAKSIDRFPGAEELRRIVRLVAPEVIFLNLEERETAEDLSRFLASAFPSIQRIGVACTEDPTTLRVALDLRMADLVTAPFAQNLTDAIYRVSQHLERHPTKLDAPGQLHAFLPAKGGVGASTLAANVSWALAGTPGSSVLLADLDCHSGVTDFIFNTEHGYTIADAIQKGAELDEEYWQRVVTRVGKVDLLLSSKRVLDKKVAGRDVGPILDFARRIYSTVNVDLSSAIDELSVNTMREASRVFVVTTPDLAALRVCRNKVRAMRELEIADKAVLVVNRVEKRMELSLEEIEKTVKLPVFATFPNHYADVTMALRNAQPAPRLAASTRKFVENLSGKTTTDERPKRTFIEFLHLNAMRRWAGKAEPVVVDQQVI
jgi:pilus assembly protein CpaE